MSQPDDIGPNLQELFSLFRPLTELPEYEIISADEVPAPYHDLLVHDQHMTVTVEAHHGDLVNVQVLQSYHEGDTYARKILLALQGSGKVVQFGIVRVNLSFVSPPVREEIVAAKTPFGRILINHNVLRRIEPTAYLRLLPRPAMMGWFGMSRSIPVYGRLGYIHCDGIRAVELVEVVAP
jgi:hypothetical protein